MDSNKPQLNLRLDPELKAWLDAKAKESRLSRTWLVNNFIREAMRNEAKSSAA